MFHIKKVKPMSDQQGKLLWLWKEVWLYRSVLENELPTSLMSLWSQSLTEWNVMIISNDQVTAVWTCIVKKIMI